MYWIYILIAAVFEISWAVGLKYSNGFTNLKASIFTVITMVLSYIGTAYAVWTGIGAVGTALYGILFFNESKEVLRILFLLLIFAGIIGLKFTSK